VWEDAMRAHLLAGAEMRETTFATEAGAAAGRVSGHRLTPDGAVPVEPLAGRALGPAGTSVASSAGDMLRFAALHIDDPALAILRQVQPSQRIHGWFDGWGLGWAWFDWEGARVWGWDSVLAGERAVLRLMPERSAAVVLLTNGDNGRALYRSLFPDLMRSMFAIGVPPLRLEPRPADAGLARFAGTYGWPDRRVRVTATPTGLLIDGDDGQSNALPLDDATFLVDPADSDTPTVTFGAFDEAGRPQVLFDMLWGLPRLNG
jgi:hypothetical protein